MRAGVADSAPSVRKPLACTRQLRDHGTGVARMSSTAYAPNRLVALSGGGADSLLYAERLRIARELHDVVAHSFAAISLHAGVAEHVKDDRPDQVGEALRAIKTVSSEASRELRAILGVLRRVDDGPSAVATRGVGG